MHDDNFLDLKMIEMGGGQGFAQQRKSQELGAVTSYFSNCISYINTPTLKIINIY